MDLKHERDVALSRARGAARDGRAYWAQAWINRAEAFAPVTDRQARYIQELLNKAQEG